MRQTTKLWITAVPMLLSVASCTHRSNQSTIREPQPTDTLYTQQRAMENYGHEPERALAIIDSAEQVGNLSDFRADLCRAKVYGRSLELLRPDTVLIICEALLNHDSVKANTELRIEVIDQLINVCRLHLDHEQWLHWATEKAALCREQARTKPTASARDQAETEALRAEAEIGVALADLGQRDEGLAKLDHIIATLDRPGSVNRFDALIIALKRKINVLQKWDQQAVIHVAQQMLDRLDRFAARPADYKDDSDRLPPTPAERACYIDFYRAQAHLFMADAYEHGGDKQKAREYLALFEKSNFSRTFTGRRLTAMLRLSLGEYDKALASFDEQQRQMKGDTVCDDYAVILLGRAKIAEQQGRLNAALDYRCRYESLRDSLQDRLLKSKANEYAARYRLQKQYIEMERLKARADRSRLIATGVVIAFILMLCGLALYWWQQHVISRKNQSLVQHISEALKYKKLYETTPDSDASPDELFDHIRHVVKREKLYLNPVFDRQAVVEYFHLPKDRIGQAFAQGSEYNSLPDFIRDCRLEHACELLASTNLSISEIATASGFSRVTTFNHDFKAKYNVAPSIYRRQLRQ